MTYWLYRAIAALPLALSYRLASLISWLTQYVIRYRVETVDRNLRTAFPEQTDAWYSETRKRFYKQFAEVTVESLYGWRMPKAELEERMKLIGWEPLLASSDESPKPGILLLYTTETGSGWCNGLASRHLLRLMVFISPFTIKVLIALHSNPGDDGVERSSR